MSEQTGFQTEYINALRTLTHLRDSDHRKLRPTSPTLCPRDLFKIKVRYPHLSWAIGVAVLSSAFNHDSWPCIAGSLSSGWAPWACVAPCLSFSLVDGLSTHGAAMFFFLTLSPFASDPLELWHPSLIAFYVQAVCSPRYYLWGLCCAQSPQDHVSSARIL